MCPTHSCVSCAIYGTPSAVRIWPSAVGLRWTLGFSRETRDRGELKVDRPSGSTEWIVENVVVSDPRAQARVRRRLRLRGR